MKRYASPENFDKLATLLVNGDASKHEEEKQKNGHHHKKAAKDDDGSELSETSDIEPLDDEDEDGAMKIGSDEEEKQPEKV